MYKIDVENLTSDDILDLIMDHELDISHNSVNKYIDVRNYQEGSIIYARSGDGISEAIRSWARKYNEMVELSNGI